MPFFSGFAGEFGRQLARSRSEEADRAERHAQLENSILQHLSTARDPEVASLAMTGLLNQAGPQGRKAKGLRGWLGEQMGNPMLPTLRDLISKGRPQEVPEMVPGEALTPETLPGATGMGPGGTPMPGAGVGGAGGAGAARAPQGPPGPATRMSPTGQTLPRRLFLQPDEQAGLTHAATTTADLEAKGRWAASVSPEIRQSVLGHVPPRAPAPHNVPGKVQASDGKWYNEQEVYDPTSDSWQRRRSETSAPTALQGSGQMVRELRDGVPVNVFYPRDQGLEPQVRGQVPVPDAVMVANDPVTGEQTAINVARTYNQQQVGGPPTRPGAAPVRAGAAPTPGQPAVSDADVIQAVGGAQAQAGGSPTVAYTPPPPRAGSTAAAAQGAAPAPLGRGVSLGRLKSLDQTPGAFLGPNGEPQVGTALFDKKLGKYYSAQDPSQEAVGFIPGAEGAYAVSAHAQASQSLLTIAAARKAIEDAGLVTNNDPAATAALMSRFYAGTSGGNPIEAAMASLTNLAGLQGATAFIKSNSRSYAMFQQALVHLPRSPSERAAQLSQFPGGSAVNPTTSAILPQSWLGGHGWDSPMSMYEKLGRASDVIQQGKVALSDLTGKTPDRAIGQQPGGGPAPAPTAPGSPPAGRGAAPAGRGRAGGAAPPPQGTTGAPPTVGEERTFQTANGPVVGFWDGRGWKAK